MYIKQTKSKGHIYLQLVEGYRDANSKVKHRVLVNLGRLDMLQKDASWKESLKKLVEVLKIEGLLDIKHCNAKKTSNWGYVIYQKLWNILGLDRILKETHEQTKITFDLNNACKLMVINHLLNPCSKLGVYHNQEIYEQYQGVELNQLYRSLDVLSEHKEKIEEMVFAKNCELYKLNVDVVFYDVTTFHFESTTKDDLKNFGFSKANKVNEVQVMLGMMIDCEGRPLGYELFPGNTFEGKTLETSLDKLSKRFGIKKVIIVADRGLNNKFNLKQITERGYGYIVASRIKNLNKSLTAEVLDQNGYQKIQADFDSFRYKIIEHSNTFKIDKETVELPEKLLISYSEKRAKKDRMDRSRLFEKAQYLLENQALIKGSNKRGGKKYLKEQGEVSWELDKDALERDAQFDGYYAIQTSESDLNAEQILDAYHSLWKIEESFRIMKSTLEVRPIFHWTERRIRGHFVICFLAFLLERTLEINLRQANVTVSANKIREAINGMQLVKMDCLEERYFLTTELTDLGNKIIEVMQITTPAKSGQMNQLKFKIKN